jgi:probable HAF family extracellular repeat protein
VRGSVTTGERGQGIPMSKSSQIRLQGAWVIGEPEADLRFQVRDLGVVEGNDNLVHAVNNRGQFVGGAINQQTGAIEAFLASNGTRTMLGTLGGSFSAAHGVNNHGHVVGGSLCQEDEDFRAFLFRNGRLYDLNSLLPNEVEWQLTQALGINDRGQIVGIGTWGGKDHAFLLTPISSQEKKLPGGNFRGLKRRST